MTVLRHGTHYDFLAFYGAGYLTAHGHITQIYNAFNLTQFQRTIIPHSVGAAGYLPFINPPMIAAILAPLSLLSFDGARVFWFALNFILISLIAYHLVRHLPDKRWQLLTGCLIICSFPVYQNFIEGQLSIIILGGALLALKSFEQKKFLTSGVFLTFLIIKPQLAIFAGLGLLIFREWKVIKGLVIGTIVSIAVTLPVTGFKVYLNYFKFLSQVTIGHLNGAGMVTKSAWDGYLNLTLGVNGMFNSVFGQANYRDVDLMTAIVAVILIGLYCFAFRKVRPGLNNAPARLMLIASIGLAMLLDPHAYAQDGVLIFLVLPILLPILKNKILGLLLFISLTDLIFLDQNYFIHLHVFGLILLTSVVLILYDSIYSQPKRKSIFSRLLAKNFKAHAAIY